MLCPRGNFELIKLNRVEVYAKHQFYDNFNRSQLV